jgi:hypothetical protein
VAVVTVAVSAATRLQPKAAQEFEGLKP